MESSYRWTPLVEYVVFKICDVSLEARFLRVIGVPA